MSSPARRFSRALLVIGVCLAALGVSSAIDAKERTHEVQKGQTLWGISRRYKVTVSDLRERNSLSKNDPIVPGQLLYIPSGDWKKHVGEAKPKEGSWVTRKPPPETQTQKSAAERGINPCNTPDPGFGVFSHWDRGPSMGQMIIPERGGITSSGRFDVMFHFHGHEAVRKEWVQVMDGAVLVGIDLGLGSGPYSAAFNSENAFKTLVKSVEKAVAEHHHRKRARARHIGLSAWSAGYGAIQEILLTSYGKRKVDTVVLLDGLHTGYYGNRLNGDQIKGFVEFAQRAARGERFMFVSHSSIIPPGYASTTETANYLIQQVGGHPRHTRPRGTDPMGLDLISRYTRGNFHVRGYKGNDKMDHCAHIGLYRDVLKVHIKNRWHSPRGYHQRLARR